MIFLLSNKIPLDTGVAFQEVQLLTKTVIGSTLSLQNLEPLVFLTSRNKVVNISDPTDLKSRPDDITFFRIRCVMNGSFIDKIVTTIPHLSFQFCLRLPQSIYDITAYTANLIKSLSVSYPPVTTTRSVNSCFSVTCIDVTINQSTPCPSTTSRVTFFSPAM